MNNWHRTNQADPDVRSPQLETKHSGLGQDRAQLAGEIILPGLQTGEARELLGSNSSERKRKAKDPHWAPQHQDRARGEG